ncbi:integrase [Helicobacter pylori]|nr:integrase [Helicobacter pylori]
MLNNKLTKSQRELFDNLKAFLYTKVKNFTPIQDVNDMALIVNYPTAKAIGLFLASSLHN